MFKELQNKVGQKKLKVQGSDSITSIQSPNRFVETVKA